jgi:hypothetical protein
MYVCMYLYVVVVLGDHSVSYLSIYIHTYIHTHTYTYLHVVVVLGDHSDLIRYQVDTIEADSELTDQEVYMYMHMS